MMLFRPAAMAIAAALLLAAMPADAQPHRQADHTRSTVHGRPFYGRSFHSFTPAERHVWRRGRWHHGWHQGRYAWWWTVGGWWYLYPGPIYPYPRYVPPAVVVQQAPPTPSGLPPMQSWYFCDNPQGYYPYIASCDGPWRTVPATPAK